MKRTILKDAMWRKSSLLPLHTTASLSTFSVHKTASLSQRQPIINILTSGCANYHTVQRTMSLLSSNSPHHRINMSTFPDPCTYTSGRWLRRDKVEQEARYISFNFDALCKKVVELCPGALSITACDKKEGGFNRVFIFTTDNGRKIVARLPFRFAGPRRLTTNSEVATINFRK